MAIQFPGSSFPISQQFRIPETIAREITPAQTDVLKQLLGSVFEMGRSMGIAQQAGILPNPAQALSALAQQQLPTQFQGMPSFTDRMSSPGYGQYANQEIMNQLRNAPLFSPDEAAMMSKMAPEEQAVLHLERSFERDAMFPPPPPGAPLFSPDQAALLSKLPPEMQAGVTLQRQFERGMVGPQLTPDQQSMLSKMPPELQTRFMQQVREMGPQVQQMNQQVAQMYQQGQFGPPQAFLPQQPGQQFMPYLPQPQQIAQQIMPQQQFAPSPMMQQQFAPSPMMQQQFAPQVAAQAAQFAATAAGIGAGSGAAVAAGAGVMPTGLNPAGNSNADLVNTIANAPLFSPDEAQLMSKLPPEQQAMMTLQAKKQRESLMTSILTNIANMKHESLKGIAQNLRG